MRERYTNPVKSYKDLIPVRKKKIMEAPAEFDFYDPMKELAEKLHPDKLVMKIEEIRDETKDTKTFRMILEDKSKIDKLPIFRAGQYLSIKGEVNGSKLTRPYSISSSPMDAIKDNYYEITVKKDEEGFFTKYIWDNWKVGTIVESSGPQGFFYYHPVRDTKNIVGLCGGSGITPMRSMMRQIIQKDLDMNFTLLYGIEHEDEIIFRDELDNMKEKSNGRIEVKYVCNNPSKDWEGPVGLLSAELIKEQVGDVEGKTFFICGPLGLYRYLDEELPKLNIPKRRIRREVYGEVKDVKTYPDFPNEKANETYNVVVNVGNVTTTIEGKATDTLLVSMEKAGIVAPSRCRSGECGYCRSKLISGDVFIRPDGDGRRIADKKYGYIHPCATYPVSNVEIEIPLIQR